MKKVCKKFSDNIFREITPDVNRSLLRVDPDSPGRQLLLEVSGRLSIPHDKYFPYKARPSTSKTSNTSTVLSMPGTLGALEDRILTERKKTLDTCKFRISISWLVGGHKDSGRRT